MTETRGTRAQGTPELLTPTSELASGKHSTECRDLSPQDPRVGKDWGCLSPKATLTSDPSREGSSSVTERPPKQASHWFSNGAEKRKSVQVGLRFAFLREQLPHKTSPNPPPWTGRHDARFQARAHLHLPPRPPSLVQRSDKAGTRHSFESPQPGPAPVTDVPRCQPRKVWWGPELRSRT